MIVRPRLAAAAALALAATAAVAQSPATVPPAPAPLDPGRVAAARPVVERIWPLGTYRRVMQATMSQMMDGVMGQMFGLKLGDLAGPGAAEGRGKGALGDTTLGELASAGDPHYAERSRIGMRVMMAEMATLMSAVEPDVRDALARAFARRFTVAELGELDRFFATPVGARYASEAMLLGADPEMTRAMMKFVPTLFAAIPEITKKVEAATAHLPKPPGPKPWPAAEESEPEDATP